MIKKLIKKDIIFTVLLTAWAVMWMLFLIRGLVKAELRDYKNLLWKTLEEKHSYVSGREFYEFVIFCKKIIPENADYTVEASYDQSMDYFRFPYYMYPSKRDLIDPEYVVCYKIRFEKTGYKRAASLAPDKYILKKDVVLWK